MVGRSSHWTLIAVDRARLAEDDFFEGQVWDGLRFRTVAKVALGSMHDRGVDAARILAWRTCWSRKYQWHPVWYEVFDPDVGERRNYHWSRYDGV